MIAKAANDYVMETNIVIATFWHYLAIVLATTITNEICVILISTLFIGIANSLCYIKEKEQNQKNKPK